MTAPTPPTTDELRAAFNRAPILHLRGWTFERAQANRLTRWALEKSALATRRTHHLPAPPALF